MKRFHVHVAVPDLAASIRFYSTLFGAEPSMRKDDYAKWMLDEPRLNFAISQRGGPAGVNHLGFQVDSGEELEALHTNLEAADRTVASDKDAHCCYARSDKYWITDPAGIAWESFHTLGSIPIFGATEATSDGCTSTEQANSAIGQTDCCTSATAAPHLQDASACCATEEKRVASPSTRRTQCCR